MAKPAPPTSLLPPTELVALSLKKGEDMVHHILQAWEAGLAVLPVDPLLPQASLQSLLASLRPSRLITASGKQILDGIPVPGETAAVLATSGTTAEPKGVELSHRALDWAARASVARLGDAAGGGWLCCLPLHHIAGLMVVLRARLRGRSPVLVDRFDVDAIMSEADDRMISLVPSALERLLQAEAEVSRFSAILLGGGPVSADLLLRAAERGAKVITSYGMTETCGGCVLDGVPLDGVQVRVAGDQILIRGPMLFSGYRLRPELTGSALRDGWFHTADRGKLLPDGRLEVLGRLDDVINTGGKKVFPNEVERILVLHPSIKEAAVVGVPSQQWGEEIAAAIVLHAGSTLDLEDLREFVCSRAPRWMAPKQIVCVRSLPKHSSGKVAYPEVARLFEKGPGPLPSPSPG